MVTKLKTRDGKSLRLGYMNRHVETNKEDFFPTEPRFVEFLLRYERFDGPIWEPACGDGSISKILKDRDFRVYSTDLYDRGYGNTGVDFLKKKTAPCDEIITNPPFSLFTEFVEHANELVNKWAFVCSLTTLSSSNDRYRRVWKAIKPSKIILVQNKMLIRYQDKKHKHYPEAKSYFNHCWVIWDKTDKSGKTELVWHLEENVKKARKE